MTFDWATFAFQLVNVLVLLAILTHFLFRPVAGIISKRQAETDAALERAEAMRAEALAAAERAKAEADANAASAGLITRLRQAQTDQSDPKRCSVISNTPYSGGQEELYKSVIVQARLRCDLESLAAILYDLESGKPYLFVDQLMIYKQQTYVPPGAKRVASPLDVRFNLSGYLREPGKAAP